MTLDNLREMEVEALTDFVRESLTSQQAGRQQRAKLRSQIIDGGENGNGALFRWSAPLLLVQ
jgi:hypothetical protein